MSCTALIAPPPAPALPAASPATHGRLSREWLERLLLPSPADLLILAVALVLFALPGGWSQLLEDGDTGWHIRTGESILRTGAVPAADPYSFSKAGQPWYAWEWLADVAFAGVHHVAGLKGVVLLAAVLICGSLLVLFRYLLWRGAGAVLAMGITILVADASRIHYLARPHLFTLLLLPVTLWLLERDRAAGDGRVWWLVPLTALWTNLHGGFLAGLAAIAFVWIDSIVRARYAGLHVPRYAETWRYGALFALCAAASLVNPFGAGLHLHIAQYLTSDWIRSAVMEFQPPHINSETMYKFELLLLAGFALLPRMLQRKAVGDALLVVFWGHAALSAARHVPLYCLAGGAMVGGELARLCRVWTFDARYTSLSRRHSIWLPVLAAFLFFSQLDLGWPRDFAPRFPAAMAARHAAALAPDRGSAPTLLAPDDWGGYLIYRHHPKLRVFMDGRSDFYGPALGKDYQCLMQGCERWEELMNRYGFDLALLPRQWPLAQMLARDARWTMVDRDRAAVLLRRR